MVYRKVLVDFWWELCLDGVGEMGWSLLSRDVRNTIVPIPKKRGKGACVMDNFRGISLLSTVYKAMCMIVQDRVTQVVVERQLLAGEQGGFRKGRGC